MDLQTFQPVFDWVAAHPGWAAGFVFANAIAESLIIVGLFIPGTVVMFGIGTLVGTGVLGLWETLWWSVAGAVVGDGISFWVGRYYSDSLKRMWPFSKRPGLLPKGEEFFRKHGGKSVLFGRFVGPVRPIIPAVAGMMRMHPGSFLVVNVASAALWAPAYMLPGLVFGTSLGLASEVATRLAVLVFGVVIGIGLIVWLIRRLTIFLGPRIGAVIDRMWAWGHSHPRLGPLAVSLVDPSHPELRGLFTWALLLLGALWAFLWMVYRVTDVSQGLTIDSSVYHALQGIRTPWADNLMAAIYGLGAPVSLAIVATGVLIWLSSRRRWDVAAHLIAAAGFGVGATLLIKAGLDLPRPPGFTETSVLGSFPSGHAVMSTVVFGFIAVLMSSTIQAQWRWIVYACAGVLILSAGMAPVVLGSSWLSDALGGVVLGFVWVVLLGLAYRRHPRSILPARGLGVSFGVSLLVAASVYGLTAPFDQLTRRAADGAPIPIDVATWWTSGWETLPKYRVDFGGGGGQPLNVQWIGDREQMMSALAADGWREPVPLTLKTGLLLLKPGPTIEELPVLPQAHNGRHESLVLVKLSPDPEKEWVLRLWSSGMETQGPVSPLWLGTVAVHSLQKPLGLVYVPRMDVDFITPVNVLASSLPNIVAQKVKRDLPDAGRFLFGHAIWDGSTLLINQGAAR